MAKIIPFPTPPKGVPATPQQAPAPAPEAPAPKVITKQEASYMEPYAACEGCIHYGEFSCEIVEGSIDPEGWCRFFEADEDESAEEEGAEEYTGEEPEGAA